MDTKVKETSRASGLSWCNKPRRVFRPEERLAMVRQTEVAGVSVAEVAQRNGVNANLLFKWKRLYERGLLAQVKSQTGLVAVRLIRTKRSGAKPVIRGRTKAATTVGAIEVEIAGARIFLHGAV